jgi:hypothetical protein
MMHKVSPKITNHTAATIKNGTAVKTTDCINKQTKNNIKLAKH